MKNSLLSYIFIFSTGISSAENFSSQTVDLGVVVTDIGRSLEFYKEVIGFSEKDGFEVKGDFPKKVGLTDGTPLKIHVLTLGTDEKATKLKLMQVKSKKSARKIKQPYIHTLSGFSYLTIFVKDVEMVLKRALEKGYKPYADSPQILPQGLPQDICLLMLKDPDGNFVEIVGPLTKQLQN